MVRCKLCSFKNPDGARYCGGCAAPVAQDQSDETRTIAMPLTPSPDAGRVPLGAVLGGRYIVLGFAGRGGMGEVYRAHDNKLDQVVALKMLPDPLRGNAAALVRLHNEVRIARQVSHPNVCRVYDIAEADGFHFLTMEFIDGEDLAHLLRRIGRFPQDKGVEIARRICAALSAAHERGVLHRDLKPANIMLNAAGQVMVMDFGLAGMAEQMKDVSAREGTPAYMAPEQLEGRASTARSDIYSLGLVLYEVFTGRRAFENQRRRDLTNPTFIAKDLDPAIERVIVRCLAEQPDERFPTAAAVSASLPGGDPLQLALAAGETPSPEMVATSGEKAGIGVRAAVLCLAAIFASLAGCLFSGPMAQVVTRFPVEFAPEALALKAREVAASAGHQGRPPSQAWGFLYDTGQIQRLERNGGWSQPALSRPSPVRFWYRESPQPMASFEMRGLEWNDPPANLPGMVSIQMDGAARLTFFRATPAALAHTRTSRPANWNALLLATGLDAATLHETPPQIVPPVFADSRKAWIGFYSEKPEAVVRVEAAELAGTPVYFRVLPPWETLTVEPEHLNIGFRISDPQSPGGILALSAALMAAIAWVAWRNVRNGRGDRRGAFRVAACTGVGLLIFLLCRGVGQLAGIPQRYWVPSGFLLHWAATSWIVYIALEPLVRRNWPHSLVSWSRILRGQFRDPLVGRDVLIGVLSQAAFYFLRTLVPSNLAFPLISGTGAMLGVVTGLLAASINSAMFSAATFALALAALRRRRVAFAVTWLLYLVLLIGSYGDGINLNLVFGSVVYSLVVYLVLFRFGVLACLSGTVTATMLRAAPQGLDFGAWYEDAGRLYVLLLAGLALYGFSCALAGRRILKADSD